MRRLIYSFLIIIPLFLIFIGPWPVDNSDYQQQDFALETFERVENLGRQDAALKLSAGYAQKNMTPAIGIPLAGYSAREPKANEGAYEALYAKALTLKNTNSSITIVNTETLLPLPKLINKVLEITQLSRADIFFTSTHTHSGPGAYAKGLIEEMAMGEYSEDYTNDLAHIIAAVIVESRKNLLHAKLSYTTQQLEPDLAQTFIYNQLQAKNSSHARLHILQIEVGEKRLANVIGFNAHPTFFGRRNKKASGDYPALVNRALENQYNSPFIFIPGAVGGMIPLSEGETPAKAPDYSDRQRKEFAARLAKLIDDTINSGETDVQFELADINSHIVDVNLPSATYRLTDSLRLSPLLVKQLFHGSESFIHALEIGNIALISIPADYAGELALDVEQFANNKAMHAWMISFNGDYIGYLTPSTYYNYDHYITRDTNMFGKYAGDYFNDVSKRIIDRMSPAP